MTVRRPPEDAAPAGPSPGETRSSRGWAWVEVDLQALGENLARLREVVAPARILAVVKADAYGHGAVTVSRTLEAAGVDWLGVARASEGVSLRWSGVAAPVLVLGPAGKEEMSLYRRHRLTPVLTSSQQLRQWVRYQQGREPLTVHCEVDTGMARLGLGEEELGDALEAVRASSGLILGGLLSHLAEADDPGSPRTARQEEHFRRIVARLTPRERQSCLVHLANSAGALHFPATRRDLVRLGLSLYGQDPTGAQSSLRPVLSLHGRVAQVRTLEAGERVGYGGRWSAPDRRRVALVPVGYGDGYPWRLGGRAEALVRGRRVPVVGAVSMDSLTLDVTALAPGVEVGERVALLGEQGEERITARELARRAGTIPYEILTGLGLRLPRIHRPRGGGEPR